MKCTLGEHYARRHGRRGRRSASSMRRTFDADSAYAAIDRHRLDDFKPYIYRTHDGGKSWQLLIATASTPAVPSMPCAPIRCAAVCSTPALRRASTSIIRRRRALASAAERACRSRRWRDLEVHGSRSRHRHCMVAVLHTSTTICRAAPGRRQRSPRRRRGCTHRPMRVRVQHRAEFTGTPLPKDEPMAARSAEGALHRLHTQAAPQVAAHAGDRHGGRAPSCASCARARPAATRQIREKWKLRQSGESCRCTSVGRAGMHRFVWPAL